MEIAGREDLPKYFDLLDTTDQLAYKQIQTALSQPSSKGRKYKSSQTFAETIEALKIFIVRNDPENDWKRAAACGIFWLDSTSFSFPNSSSLKSTDGASNNTSTIAINIRQFKTLTSKCKSSINGHLQQMGYVMPIQGTEASNALVSVFPFLKNNFQELRQWTIRQRSTNNQIKQNTDTECPELNDITFSDPMTTLTINPTPKVRNGNNISTIPKSTHNENNKTQSRKVARIILKNEIPQQNLPNKSADTFTPPPTFDDFNSFQLTTSNFNDSSYKNSFSNDKDFLPYQDDFSNLQNSKEILGIYEDPMTFATSFDNDNFFGDSFSFNPNFFDE